MRIVSYNIRKSVGLDWRRDPNRIVDILTEINPDVVVLQEADKRIGGKAGVLSSDRLLDELGLSLVEFGGKEKSHGWHGNAIFIRSEFSILETQCIDLPSIEPRGAVSVRIVQPDVEIVGTHLGLSRGVRRKQIDKLREHINRANHPTVLAGDFNDWQNDEKFAQLFGNGFNIVSPGKSFHTSRPVATLDRFVLSGEIAASSSGVHSSKLAKSGSDHLPIVINVDVPGKVA